MEYGLRFMFSVTISICSQVIMRKLWFNQTIKEAVDETRFHHQITPMVTKYEFGVIEVRYHYFICKQMYYLLIPLLHRTALCVIHKI